MTVKEQIWREYRKWCGYGYNTVTGELRVLPQLASPQLNNQRDTLRNWIAGEPGLGMACCDWLRTRDVAAVCADNYGIEAMPAESEGEMYPLHLVLIRDMGMMLGEVFDLEELAADCAADGVYEFLFAGPPIEFTHAVGSPVNPLAIK